MTLLLRFALALVLVSTALAQDRRQVNLGGEGSTVLVFPADSLLIVVQGEAEARVTRRLGLDRGPDLYPDDQVTVFNDVPVTGGHQLKGLYDALAVGDTVRLVVDRDGQTHQVVFPKPERPQGRLAIAPSREQLAAMRSALGWGGTALASDDEVARWVPSGDATVTHEPINGTLIFEGETPGDGLHFEAEEPLDVHRKEGLRIRFKGDGGAYRVRLTDTSGTSATLSFDTGDGRWAVREMPFAALTDPVLDLAQIARIELVPDAAPFRIEVDAIEPY